MRMLERSPSGLNLFSYNARWNNKRLSTIFKYRWRLGILYRAIANEKHQYDKGWTRESEVSKFVLYRRALNIACDMHEAGKITQKDIAAALDLPSSTIPKIVKDRKDRKDSRAGESAFLKEVALRQHRRKWGDSPGLTYDDGTVYLYRVVRAVLRSAKSSVRLC